ncbi:MAG: 2-phospho-L-lactate transferase [Actinomycetales bacterium]|nr:2-phospho-L-lactate transferase [Actinomycetales bacterium]
MKIVLLAGGVGGARFTRGLRDLGRAEGLDLDLTVVVNTGDDLWLDALRVCPDLDTVMYTLGGVIGDQGWGRAGESTRVTAELHAYGLGWDWFTLGDLDLGTHVARTELLRSGLPLSAVTARLCERWQPGATLLPMSDDEVETWVEVEADGEVTTIHFEEWWVRHRAALPARRFLQRGVGGSRPAPGVLEAIGAADLVVLPPSNPVVSVGTILGVPGIRDAVRAARAPVVGVSPIIGGAPVRGMADACLTAIGVETSARAVAEHYGARSAGGVLDGWLVDDADADAVAPVRAAGVEARALPLLMADEATTAAIARAALDLGRELAASRTRH